MVEYLQRVSNIVESNRNHTPKDLKAISLTKAFAELPNFVPSMLHLPEEDQELAVSIKLVQLVLDAKLADRPLALIIVILDILSVLVALWGYMRVITFTNDPFISVFVLIFTNVYFATREGFQLYNMYVRGLAWEFFRDGWNMVDILGFTCSFAVAGMALSSLTRETNTFRFVAALGSFGVWLKMLATVKVLSINLATFMYSLGRIISDLGEFLFVMVAVTFMFATSFYVLLGVDEEVDDEFETGGFIFDTRPFQTFTQASLSLFNTMMGNFESDWFETSASFELSIVSTILFIFFMFLVVIVMLNVLIAIVSLSYSDAKSKAKKLFLKSRLELVAELDALGYTKEKIWWLPNWINTLIQKSDFHFFRLCKNDAVPEHEDREDGKFNKAIDQITQQKEQMNSMAERLEKIESALDLVREHLLQK